MTKVLYPGSFDPFTKGHMDIVEQASNLFDEVIIAILYNSAKKTSFFTLEERMEMIKELYSKMENIKVISSDHTTVKTAMLYGCKAIVRGLRNVRDFDEELTLSRINEDLSNNKVKTITLFSDRCLTHVSSTLVREMIKYNEDISPYVAPIIKEKIVKKGSY